MKKVAIVILNILFISICSAEPLPELQTQNRGLKIVHKVQEVKQQEQRVALVIGNNNYSGMLSKLHNPVNDALAMKNVLEQKGFKVIYGENSTKKEMNKKLEMFYSTIKEGGIGMFYFAGHGIEVEGINYLIPTDSKIKEKSDTEYEALNLNKITKRMQKIGNRLNIIVLDACRNDPFSRGIGIGGLAKTEPIGMFVAYSTGAGSVASDGKLGEHGLFTSSLIKYIKRGLSLRDVFQQTRAEVYKKSNKKQFPAIYDQTINGDFYFTKSDKETPIVSNEPTRSTAAKSTDITNNIVIESKLKEHIKVSLQGSNIKNGMLEIVLNIQNLKAKKQTLHYRVKWLDSEGFEVGESLSIWQPLFIDVDESKKIKELSMVPNAHSYKIYFK